MNYELPDKIEICLAVVNAENPVEWINIESGETMDSRAFDWDTLTPIVIGRERAYENKEFIHKFCGEANLTGFLAKHDWKSVAAYIEQKTGVLTVPNDLEEKIRETVESGAKRIIIVSKAMTQGRKACEENRLVYRVNNFNSDNIDYQTGWNTRINAKGGKWLVKTKNITVNKVVQK